MSDANYLNNSKYCIGLFLDLKKAFDVCDHSILLKKLKKFGVKNEAHNWFRSYLTNRVQKVDIAGQISSPKVINISVLQGTTLGPILFLCYINNIFYATNLATYLFADDTSCLAEHSNLNELISFINEELHKLANWFKSNKMAVNVSKTKYKIFRTRGKTIDSNIDDILFNNNEIGTVNDVYNIFKLERVYSDNPNIDSRNYKLFFDEFLSFDKHISYICAKLSKANFCIKHASNKLSLKSLKALYYALVHPHLFLANKILPFEKLMLQSKLLFMHSIHYEYAPKSFHNIFTKNLSREINYELRNADAYLVPAARIELFKKFLLYTFPTAWNEVGIFAYYSNRITFSIALKEHLFSLI